MHHDIPPPPDRRSFLDWAIHGLGTLFAAVLAIPAIAYLIDARNRKAPPGKFKAVARVSELEVGKPTQVVIRDIRQDAWTLHPNDVIGRVWLVKRDEKTVDAYTTICPHLGCSVNFDGTRFVCPCHNGTFDVNGQRVETSGVVNPAPRGMDLLEQPKPDDPEYDKEVVKVKYQNFVQGRHDQVPKA